MHTGNPDVLAQVSDLQPVREAVRTLVRGTARRYVTGEDRRAGPGVAKLFRTGRAAR